MGSWIGEERGKMVTADVAEPPAIVKPEVPGRITSGEAGEPGRRPEDDKVTTVGDWRH